MQCNIVKWCEKLQLKNYIQQKHIKNKLGASDAITVKMWTESEKK